MILSVKKLKIYIEIYPNTPSIKYQGVLLIIDHDHSNY